MTRIIDDNGVVHFRNPADMARALCCAYTGTFIPGLFGFSDGKLFHETTERVNCPACARVVCAIRNEPYNSLVAEVTDAALDRGIYDAVKPDWEVTE